MTKKKNSRKDRTILKNKDEFYKFLYICSVSVVKCIRNNNENDTAEDAIFVSDCIKEACHEYLSLVESGEIDKESRLTNMVTDEEYKEMRKNFEETRNSCNVALFKGGVPFKEGESGNLEIDFEKMSEEE